jgi:hypothetical protein
MAAVETEKRNERECPHCKDTMRSDVLYRHFTTHAEVAVRAMTDSLRLKMLEAQVPIVISKDNTLAVCLMCKKGADKLNRKNPDIERFCTRHECRMVEDDEYHKIFNLQKPVKAIKIGNAAVKPSTGISCSICSESVRHLERHLTYTHVHGPLGKVDDISEADLDAHRYDENRIVKHKTQPIWYCLNLFCDFATTREAHARLHQRDNKKCREACKVQHITGNRVQLIQEIRNGKITHDQPSTDL